MTQYQQHQIQGSHFNTEMNTPLSYSATQAEAGAYVMAPPPMGYPVKDGHQTVSAPHQTVTKGSDGFLRGCLAAMCCCCVLDCVF